ncbi:MAG: hypothetical protein Q4G45_10085 [Actinomycetia bacterium]|nr:hypothetical protein [Actinomycetes bacterium]
MSTPHDPLDLARSFDSSKRLLQEAQNRLTEAGSSPTVYQTADERLRVSVAPDRQVTVVASPRLVSKEADRAAVEEAVAELFAEVLGTPVGGEIGAATDQMLMEQQELLARHQEQLQNEMSRMNTYLDGLQARMQTLRPLPPR